MVDPDDISIDPLTISDANDLAAEDVKRIARLLLDVESWFFARKRCVPKGTAIMHLNSRAGSVRLMIGMSCADWELHTGDNRKSGFFDPVADQVRDILKRTFPDIASSGAQSMWKAGAISQLKQSFLASQIEPEQSDEPRSRQE